jgi:hypothetical protein
MESVFNAVGQVLIAGHSWLMLGHAWPWPSRAGRVELVGCLTRALAQQPRHPGAVCFWSCSRARIHHEDVILFCIHFSIRRGRVSTEQCSSRDCCWRSQGGRPVVVGAQHHTSRTLSKTSVGYKFQAVQGNRPSTIAAVSSRARLRSVHAVPPTAPASRRGG